MKALLITLFSGFMVCCGSPVQRITIKSLSKPCAEESHVNCFQIRKDSTGKWENLSGSITGINYEPGTIYTLAVTVEADNNYTVKRILQKQKDIISTPQGTYFIVSFQDNRITEYQGEITFTKEGQVYGKGICNNFTGTYAATKDGKIKFSQAATTKMMCKEPGLERDFFHTMNAVENYTLEEGNLQLFIKDEVVFTATKTQKE